MTATGAPNYGRLAANRTTNQKAGFGLGGPTGSVGVEAHTPTENKGAVKNDGTADSGTGGHVDLSSSALGVGATGATGVSGAAGATGATGVTGVTGASAGGVTQLQADATALTGSFATQFTIACASGDVVAFTMLARVTAVQASDAFAVTVAGVNAGATHGFVNDQANNVTTIVVGSQAGFALPPTGSGQDMVVEYSGVVVANTTSVLIQAKNTTASRGVFKKGSTVFYSKTT